MVKIKKKLKLQKLTNPNNYQIKTRNRDKKLCSMTREIKNLQETQWFANTNGNASPNNLKIYPTDTKSSEHAKQRLTTRFSKIFKKIKNKKDLKLKKKLIKNNTVKKVSHNGLKSNNLNYSNHSHSSKNSKKMKNNKIENAKKTQNDIYKYNYQNKDYFELKEVLGFLYDELNIDYNSPNNKIKDREEFKEEMNDMFKNYCIIYFNKILITPDNLYIFFDYLSKYVKLNANEIINLLNKKCKTQKIEEKISLQQYFNPTLFLIEK